MPVILATQDAEIRRMAVQSQPWPIVRETLSRQNPSQKRLGGLAQDVVPLYSLLNKIRDKGKIVSARYRGGGGGKGKGDGRGEK
jgi:hypothetical protein